jgi:hypothetical protein
MLLENFGWVWWLAPPQARFNSSKGVVHRVDGAAMKWMELWLEVAQSEAGRYAFQNGPSTEGYDSKLQG